MCPYCKGKIVIQTTKLIQIRYATRSNAKLDDKYGDNLIKVTEPTSGVPRPNNAISAIH